MSHTNTTPNYNLPQFVGSDKPAWLTDVNNAMSAIDTAIAAAKAAADNAGGATASLATTVGGHTTQLETLSTTVTNQGTAIVSQGNAINTISELIGNGTPTTTDHTLIGAINELNAKEGDLADLTTTDKSSLVAAINEAAQSGGGGGGTGEHIEVTGDGSATRAQKLNELYGLADFTKLTGNSYIKFAGNVIYKCASITDKGFTHIDAYSNTINVDYITLSNNASHKYGTQATSGTVTTTTDDSTVLASGVKIELYY